VPDDAWRGWLFLLFFAANYQPWTIWVPAEIPADEGSASEKTAKLRRIQFGSEIRMTATLS
jgi:hypothetical protein